jgi:fatty-acyl-CoA synthase
MIGASQYMELYQLQYFIEVARNRNFTRAGKRLNLATPALSLQIKKLEKELGTRLFNRGQKETVMTPAGETLFQKAQALLSMADSVKQSVAEISDLRVGRLSLAFIPSMGARWLPGILKEFKASFPCLNLLTHEETSQGVAALIEEASAELGFLELPTNNQLFEVSEIWNEPFYAVLPAEHALAGKKNISLQQLEKDSFIVKRGESRQQTIEACRSAGFEPRIACECTEQETKIALVQAGLGVLLLPQLDACVLREGVVATPIREPKLVREVGLIHRRGKELSSAARAFVEFVKQRPFPIPSQPASANPAKIETIPGNEPNLLDHAAPEGLLTPQKFLERSALVFPDKLAIKSGLDSFTYSEFHARVNRLASALRNAGLEKGDRVAFICSNIPPLIEAHYGVALAGGILVPINVRFTAGEIAYILNHSNAKFLFADSDFGNAVRPILGNLESLKKVIDIPDGRGAKSLAETDYDQFLLEGNPRSIPSPLRDEEELLSLNYTSGTTGKPKGVMIVHRGAYLNAIGQVIEGRLTAESKYLWTLPMFHCNGWCYTWAVTAVAGTHVCLRKFDPAKVWELIQVEGITHLSGSPNMFAALLNHPERPKELKREVVFGIGGSQPSPMLIGRSQEIGARVIHGYGLTETYGPCTVCEPKPDWEKLSDREEARLLSRQGVPSIMGDSVRVVDEHMRDTRKDGRSMGEVVMRGATVMKGYYKEPEATARDFRGGWFHSGDLAVVHPDGYIELRDRLRDIIVVGGDNVSSHEVEETLAMHPAVADAAVVGVPHERWGETPKAFVVLKEGAQVKPKQLIHFCREHLAIFKCPTDIEFIQSLPKTGTGKTQKFLLREREWVGEEKRIHAI